ncbi:hypothetical protein M0R45_035509 [Rubus argutus]|uniref:Uncharacterized protein n=1 Tax=Rubus argutus TaxID=59490 RepID=A0AAW1VW89_RUBAR
MSTSRSRNKEVKDEVRDKIERGIVKLHKATDSVTSLCRPLAIADGVVHGIARGALNWITDMPSAQDHHCTDEKPKPASGGSDGDAINIHGNEVKDNHGNNNGISNIGNRS